MADHMNEAPGLLVVCGPHFGNFCFREIVFEDIKWLGMGFTGWLLCDMYLFSLQMAPVFFLAFSLSL
jgi:hypothetical protein